MVSQKIYVVASFDSKLDQGKPNFFIHDIKLTKKSADEVVEKIKNDGRITGEVYVKKFVATN